MTKAERIAAFLLDHTSGPAGMSGEEFLIALRAAPADLFDPDGEFEMVGDDFGGFTTAVPGSEAGTLWSDWTDTYESYRLEAVDLEEGDEVVVFLLNAHGRTRTGGVEVEHEAAGVFRFGGDRVVRVELYLDWNQAREAAGLERR